MGNSGLLKRRALANGWCQDQYGLWHRANFKIKKYAKGITLQTVAKREGWK